MHDHILKDYSVISGELLSILNSLTGKDVVTQVSSLEANIHSLDATANIPALGFLQTHMAGRDWNPEETAEVLYPNEAAKEEHHYLPLCHQLGFSEAILLDPGR